MAPAKKSKPAAVPSPARKKAARTASPPAARIGDATVPLDGDLVFLIDALYRELAVKSGFAASYAEVQQAIGRLLDQMAAGQAREYFASSLFLNYVAYENEMADRLAERIHDRARRSRR